MTQTLRPHNNWYTPKSLITAIRDFYQGAIDTDPASCEYANYSICAQTFYNEAENGLIKPWLGNVYCYPPYVNGAAAIWLRSAVEKWLDREFDQAIFLINRSDNRQIYEILDSPAICAYYQFRFRLKLINGNKDEPKCIPKYNNDLIYFGHKAKEFNDFCYTTFGQPAPATNYRPYVATQTYLNQGVLHNVR